MEKSNSHFLVQELNEAKSKGFIHDFILHVNGLLYCLAYPNHYYEMHEFSAIAIPCSLLNATLYLISTNDGICGTMIEYWECFG